MMFKRSFSFCVLCSMLAVALLVWGCKEEKGTTPKEAKQEAQQVSGVPLAPQYFATLSEGIDFRKEGYPDFLMAVYGMSGREDWGRWTDANLAPSAKFLFKKPLPEKFTLELKAVAFGPNIGEPVKVKAGNVEKSFTVKSPSMDGEVFRIEFDGVKGNTIEIIPPKPTAPKDAGVNPDTRKLGVGLIYMKILE